MGHIGKELALGMGCLFSSLLFPAPGIQRRPSVFLHPFTDHKGMQQASAQHIANGIHRYEEELMLKDKGHSYNQPKEANSPMTPFNGAFQSESCIKGIGR